MKAVGIPAKGIRSLYMGEIRILMGIGCVAGYAVAIPTVSFLTGHISRTFGRCRLETITYIAAVGIAFLVYGMILLFTGKVLNRLRKVTVVDALVTGKGFAKERKTKDGIHKARRLSVNLLLGMQEVRHGYGIIFALLMIVTFLVTVPYRMVQTMEDKAFAAYMGTASYDVAIEIEQGENLEERMMKAEQLIQTEQKNGYADCYTKLRRVRLQAEDQEGKLQGIHIDTGEEAGKGIRYLTGQAPATETEIALSCLMAEQLGKNQGESVTIICQDKEQEFLICGIYQDVTSGGKTAKAVYAFPETEAEKYAFEVNLGVKPDSRERVAVWREELGKGYTVEYMEDFIGQTLGGVTAQVRQAAYTAFVIGICLIGMIVMLYMNLRIASEAGMLAGKKAVGIPLSDIYRQELHPVLLAGGLGTVSGIVLAGVAGDRLFSTFFGMLGLGIKQIEFVPMSMMMCVVIPGLLLAVLGMVTIVSCRQIRTIPIRIYFNE